VLDEGAAEIRELDEHDVAKLVGRVLGDPDDRLVALDADPLVILRVAQIAGDHRIGSSSVPATSVAGVVGNATRFELASRQAGRV
jgi:hypothetical protein